RLHLRAGRRAVDVPARHRRAEQRPRPRTERRGDRAARRRVDLRRQGLDHRRGARGARLRGHPERAAADQLQPGGHRHRHRGAAARQRLPADRRPPVPPTVALVTQAPGPKHPDTRSIPGNELKGYKDMTLRRARKLALALPIAATVAVAACSSSSSSSSAAAPASSAASGAASSSAGSSGGASTAGLKTGLKVFVIPKNLGNSYFTTADSADSGGAISALQALGETGTETSGTAATPASQIPAIQAAISKGANALIVSATDPTALCPTLKSAMSRGITVITYDSDAPTCRSMFINQASTAQIGTSEVDVLAKQIGSSGQIAIVSAAASATNQNAWIGFMKQELKKYPKMTLVSTVYGNDDPTTATQLTQGLLRQYPNLAGIISPTTVGIAAAAAVLDSSKYRGKVMLTGLGTPDEMKKF